MEQKNIQQETDSVENTTVLKVTKEIIIKFIETGRVTPATFNTTFKSVYKTINETVNKKRNNA